MFDIPNNLWYIEISNNDIELFIWAIALFKNAVCTILVSEDKLFISPDLDYSNHTWFDKYCYIITERGLVPWNMPK